MIKLIERASLWSDRVFMTSNELRITYEQLHHQTVKVANVLRKMSMNKGDKISLLLPNTPEFAFCFFGVQLSGCIPNPLNTRLSPREIINILFQVRPNALVTTPEFYTAIQSQQPKLTFLRHIFVIGSNSGSQSLEGLMAQVSSTPDYQPVDANDTALLLHTSGTTGQPRGVSHSYKGLHYMSDVVPKAFHMTADDNFLCIMPLYHAFGLAVNLLIPFALGARVTVTKRFVPEAFWQHVEEHKCTIFAGVPTMYIALLRAPAGPSPGQTSLRLGISGGSTLAPEVKQEFSDRFGCPIVEAYGTTEAFVSHMLSFNESTRSGCIGKILDAPLYKADIVDDLGRSLPPYETGELRLQAPTIMQSYYNDPEGTAQTIKNGWLYTGDEGFRDEDNYFYLVGRKHDLIKRGGERIVPQEIETVLCRHPKILEAVVVGVQDEFWGQEVKAFIVVKHGHSLSGKETIAFCKRNLAEYKCPKLVEFVESLPKDPMGKISRRLLREMSG